MRVSDKFRPVAAAETTHLTPDGGIEAFREPYPRIDSDPDGMRMVIHGGHPVEVLDLRGNWAHIVVEGTDCGWVNGQLLVPPAVPQITVQSRAASLAVAPPSRRAVRVTVDAVVSAVAGVAIVVGSFLDWASRSSLNSFKVPVQFLFDPHTTSEQPRLGALLFLIGMAGAVVSFFPSATLVRVLCGALALAAGALYMISVARALNDAHSTRSFTDLVGAGPWVVASAGLVMLCSPAFRRRYT